MNLRKLQNHWYRLGGSDPLHAVLTVGDQWQIEDFFETAKAEVQRSSRLKAVGWC